MAHALETSAAVTGAVPVYELAFRPDRSAVRAVKEVVASLEPPAGGSTRSRVA
jgi:hypothetical protein